MRPLPLVLMLSLVPACTCRTAPLVDAYDAGCVAEKCNGLDDDCNGVIDDLLPSLVCGVGACRRIVASCVEGVTQPCLAGTPIAESCNGLDDDCNGQIDDDVTPTTCGVGACLASVAGCVDGIPSTCVPSAPSEERCDRIDNDCDGAIDQGLPEISCGVGQCARHVASCLDGTTQTCTPGAPTLELCNQLDDDCDGQVDEEHVCDPPVVVCPASTTMLLNTQLSITASAAAARPGGAIAQTSWSMLRAPAQSTAVPSSPGALTTQFTADRDGIFVLQFCATDDRGLDACCTTELTTSACASPPPPPVSTACGTSWDGRPIVQFDPVPVGLTYQLSVAGQPLVVASAAAGANHLRPALRIAAGGPMPGTPVSMAVRACRIADASCCSAPAALTVAVVESCTAPIAPTPTNLVLSEYITNGEGSCPSSDCINHDTCQAGEAVEITNLSNCPVSLDGFHFAYRNAAGSLGSARWMNFAAADVVPPRGVYVAIRNRQFAPTCAAGLRSESPGLFGLRISALAVQGSNLCSGWFNNVGGGLSEMQLAPGAVTTSPNFDPALAITRVAPYLPPTGSSPSCTSIGFDAVDSCGSVVGGTQPTAALSPNQLGRLWHPCDAVLNAVPACMRD